MSLSNWSSQSLWIWIFFFIQAIVKLVIFVLYNASYLHISFWMTFHPHARNMNFCQLNQQLESFGKVGLLWYLHHSLGISFLLINKILCSQKKKQELLYVVNKTCIIKLYVNHKWHEKTKTKKIEPCTWVYEFQNSVSLFQKAFLWQLAERSDNPLSHWSEGLMSLPANSLSKLSSMKTFHIHYLPSILKLYTFQRNNWCMRTMNAIYTPRISTWVCWARAVSLTHGATEAGMVKAMPSPSTPSSLM